MWPPGNPTPEPEAWLSCSEMDRSCGSGTLTDKGTMCDVSTSGLAQRLLGSGLGELTPTRSTARALTSPLRTHLGFILHIWEEEEDSIPHPTLTSPEAKAPVQS